MVAQRRPILDRRVASRVKVELRGRFACEKIEHEAVITNISFISAFLKSSFVPATGSNIALKIESPLLEAPLTLEGIVVRYACSNEELGIVDSFAVRFNRIDQELVLLVNQLAGLKMS